MTWIVAQQKRGGGAIQHDLLCIVDEIVIDTSSTQEAAAEYLSRGYDRARTVVYGDAAGHHSTTLSDYVAIKNAGFSDIRVPKANPLVLDRVAAVNAKLKNAQGEIGMLIHPGCKHLIEDLARVGFKPGTRRIDKSDPKRTHASDAVGYCIVRLWPAHRSHKVTVRNERY